MNVEKRISRLEKIIPEPPQEPHFFHLIMAVPSPTREQEENAMKEMKRRFPNEGGHMLLWMADGTCRKTVAGGHLVMEFDKASGAVINVRREDLPPRRRYTG